MTRVVPSKARPCRRFLIAADLAAQALEGEQTTIAVSPSCRLRQSRQWSLTLALPSLPSRGGAERAVPAPLGQSTSRVVSGGVCYADEEREKGDT